MAEQDQNRSEQATPFRKEEAKKRGQVAKSLDFNSFVAVLGMILVAAFCGPQYWMVLCRLCARLFASSGSLDFTTADAAGSMDDKLLALLGIVFPFLLGGVVAAIASNLVQTGFIFSGDPLKPKFERLNPVAGFKRIFNKRMLFEALKSVGKLAFFGTITGAFFYSILSSVLTIGHAEAQGQAAWLGSTVMALLFRLGLALAAVGLIDLVFTRWQFSRQLMMSRREVKEEVKRREGDPQIRAKIRELQRENSKQARSMGRLPDADVLITNPTHFAVALQYERGAMNAPVILAKGSDHWAKKMRDIARRHGVPINERRSLARLLFKRGIIDQPIPAEAFFDVARVYADLPRRADARYEVRH